VGSLNTLWQVRQLKKAECMPPQEIQLLRERRLHRILRHALAKSEFYKDHYEKHGIGLDDVDRVPLSALPTINKKIMMENFDGFVCDPTLKKAELEGFVSDPSSRGRKYRKRYEVIHTSGSSGSIGLFVYGPRDWDRLRAIVLARVTRTKLNPLKKIRLAYIGATDGNYAGISLARAAPRLFYRVLPVHINSPIDDIVRRIGDFQPDSLSGYSSGIYLLAREQMAGRLSIWPKSIVCSADPLTDEMRDTVRKAFAVDPTCFYAASESIGMASECDNHQGFHLFDDWHCFEVVDSNFNHVGPGEPGRLLLTTLYNFTHPLIRYEMGDEVVLDEEACKCRWMFPLIKRIAGRSEEFLWFERPDGKQECIHPLVMVEFMAPGLEKLQVVEVHKNRLLLKAAIHGDPDRTLGAMRERMHEILKSKGLEAIVEFDIQIVDRIDNDPKTGKYRLIVPFRPATGRG
jgi:phenylacetate-CoA ligase